MTDTSSAGIGPHAAGDVGFELQGVSGFFGTSANRSSGEARFAALRDKWISETKFISNLNKKVLHPAYQQIIGMGSPAVPLILRELAERGPGDWFWALTAITGESPIGENIAGNMKAMTEAWLRWAEARRCLNS